MVLSLYLVQRLQFPSNSVAVHLCSQPFPPAFIRILGGRPRSEEDFPLLHTCSPILTCFSAGHRDDTAASEEDEKEKARLRQAEAAREAEARKERKRRANERKAAQKAAASKAREVQKSAAAAAAAAVTAPEAMADVSGAIL